MLSSRLKGGGAAAAVLSAGAGGWKSVGLPATVDFAAFWATARGRRARARRIFGLWLRLQCLICVCAAVLGRVFDLYRVRRAQRPAERCRLVVLRSVDVLLFERRICVGMMLAVSRGLFCAAQSSTTTRSTLCINPYVQLRHLASLWASVLQAAS